MRVRVGLAQLNTKVGDLDGNVEAIIAAIKEAEQAGCDLVTFPELAITGYPPEDLVLKPAFVVDNQRALERVAAASGPTTVIVGFVDGEPGQLANAAAVCAGGRIVGAYHKRRLPNYAVFDEQRYFEPGHESIVLFEVAGVKVGVSICEDAWAPGGPIQIEADGGAELVVNINASPYHAGKVGERGAVLAERATESSAPIVYVNQVGGQDELVFDGASMVVGADGSVLARAPQFSEVLFIADVEVAARPPAPAHRLAVVEAGAASGRVTDTPASPSAAVLDPVREVYQALVTGTRDYVTKNGFHEVVIALSGGIDSTLVACIAADAIGADRVHGVLMPSRYSSDHSITDAEDLSRRLGLDDRVIAIEPAIGAFSAMLEPSFVGREPDLTEENLQSRVRGVVLMALSNKFGWLVLTTSNKSESAVGYSTLYGDSAGGFAVIKDVPKLLVYDLCRARNEWAIADGSTPPIPDHVIAKPPSAELRPGQRDDQSLPPYEVLDPLLEAYVEDDKTAAELVAAGFDADLVHRVVRLVDLAEYKRRQFPPGVRITRKAFGKDRRLPITNGYHA